MSELQEQGMPRGQAGPASATGLTMKNSASETGSSERMLDNANRTTDFLKSIAHAGRLMILCRLAEGPATVSQLEELLHMSQSSVSKQLARLREENLVDARRQGRSIYYSLTDEKARRIVGTLYELFCDIPAADPGNSPIPDAAHSNEQTVRD